MEKEWGYDKDLNFDFWSAFQRHNRSERNSRKLQKRDESESRKRTRNSLKFSWWSEEWWYDFVYTPLALKYGVDTIDNMELERAFKLKSSLDAQDEFKSYYRWRSELGRKKSKSEMYNSSGAFMGMDAEADDSIVDKALESADEYKKFLFGRGLS